ncbi:MAG: RsiV family protein [Bacteroidota bacterium]
MKNPAFRLPVPLSSAMLLLGILACNALVPSQPASTPAPPVPTVTKPPVSAQVTLVSQALNETNQNPPFRINAQIPRLTGSDDPRVAAFNQRLDDLVKKEVDTWRGSFQQVTYVSNGSSLDATYTLISQLGDLWSLKFDFNFYSDGAAHPGLYSITLNYDLGQGRELALGDLFLPNSNYLDVIANYCIGELGRQPGFEGPFAEGARPTTENYRNWNITSDGLLITFDTYQVAPGASGPLHVLVPYAQMQEVIDPHGPLAGIVK